MITLNAEKRDTKLKVDLLRKNGKLPAVFYGKKEKSTPIMLSEREFHKAIKSAGESSIIVLKGEWGEVESLINDIDRDPVTGAFRHADFYVIEKGKKVKVKIPIEFLGVSPAVKDLGGTLVKVMHELEIEAMPKDLPKNISIDIASLVNFESQILAKDIKLPGGVTLTVGAEEVIAAVSEAKEEEEAPAAPVDLSTIEVEKKGKEAKEGEEGEAGAPAEPSAKAAGDKKAPKK